MFNKVVLVGNLTRDIELRYTTNGSAIGNTAIAVTRKFTVNGEKREETCFIDISFFGKQAETANQYLSKGSKLLIEGRLSFQQWTDNMGQNRSKHSISVENMEMLGGGSANQNSYQNSSYQQPHTYQNNGQQGGYNNQQRNMSGNNQNNFDEYQQNSTQQRNFKNNANTQNNNVSDETFETYEEEDQIPF